jgi:hypothetical protein
MDKFYAFRMRFPDAIKEEILIEGTYFTLARVSAIFNSDLIIGEGLARRSGQVAPDSINPELGKNIALGRATVACAVKLANHKSWVKMRSLLMA